MKRKDAGEDNRRPAQLRGDEGVEIEAVKGRLQQLAEGERQRVHRGQRRHEAGPVEVETAQG